MSDFFRMTGCRLNWEDRPLQYIVVREFFEEEFRKIRLKPEAVDIRIKDVGSLHGSVSPLATLSLIDFRMHRIGHPQCDSACDARRRLLSIAYRWSFVLVINVFLMAFGSEAQAQHCGRVNYVPAWDNERLSWESAAEVLRKDRPDGAGRIRTAACEGPLCRSRVPEPFAAPSTGGHVAAPLPWVCTAVVLPSRGNGPNDTLILVSAVPSANPSYDPLFEPPRIG
jgi:hypothetical protein